MTQQPRNSPIPDTLECFLYVDKFVQQFGPPAQVNLPSNRVESLVDKHVMRVAKYFNFPCSALWNARVAKLVLDLGFQELALGYYKQALSEDEACPLALIGIGVVHARMHNYGLAIRDTNTAVNHCEEGNLMKKRCHINIALWHEELYIMHQEQKLPEDGADIGLSNDLDQARMHFRKAFELSPFDFRSIPVYLAFANRRHFLDDIARVIKVVVGQFED